MGNYNITNTPTNVGSQAIGEGAIATGGVAVSGGVRVGTDYEKCIRDARKALVDDEDRLEGLSQGLSDALVQFLRLAREIQIDQRAILDGQNRIQASVDDLWEKQVAQRHKGITLPAVVEVAKASAPVLSELMKLWSGH